MYPDSTLIIKKLNQISLDIQKIQAETATETTLENTQAWLSVFDVGILLLFLGVALYLTIWFRTRKELPSRSFFKSLDYIIAFTPNVLPVWHIFAGIFFTVGFGLVIGYGLGNNTVKSQYENHSMAISISGMVFSVLLAFTSFWTLHQTKKIEHQQGFKVDNFETLIELMIKELRFLDEDIYLSKGNKLDYHRVFFITEHPFFGAMSLAETRIARDFHNLLDNFLKHYERGHVDFQIVCADSSCVGNFIKDRYESRDDAKIDNAKLQFEADILPFVTKGVAIRKSDIPEYPQFIIIGKTIFEFVLRPQKPKTFVESTHVHYDTFKCNLYIKTFDTLKRNLPPII